MTEELVGTTGPNCDPSRSALQARPQPGARSPVLGQLRARTAALRVTPWCAASGPDGQAPGERVSVRSCRRR
jgi:hypothetical protein